MAASRASQLVPLTGFVEMNAEWSAKIKEKKIEKKQPEKEKRGGKSKTKMSRSAAGEREARQEP